MKMLQLQETDKGHFYTTPLGELPSVTTILAQLAKPALIGWAVKVTTKYYEDFLYKLVKDGQIPEYDSIPFILDEGKKAHRKVTSDSADLGSAVHQAVELYLQKKPYTLTAETQKPFDAFLKWCVEHKFELIESEMQLYSPTGYAGTLDLICKLDGKTYLVDIKSSNAIYDEYLLQISAYKKAYEESEKVNIDGVGIVRLGKTKAEFEWKEWTIKESDKAFEMFKHLLAYYQLKKEKI